jgi:hypothetical protein
MTLLVRNSSICAQNVDWAKVLDGCLHGLDHGFLVRDVSLDIEDIGLCRALRGPEIVSGYFASSSYSIVSDHIIEQ